MSNYSIVQDEETLNILSQKWSLIDFGELIDEISSGNKKLKKSEYKAEGEIPVVDQGKDLIAGYTDESCINSNPPFIVFGDHTRIFKYVDFDLALGADGVKLLKVNEKYQKKCLSRFLYYFFQTLNIPDTGYSRHYKYLKNIKIPLPSLEEQKFIVNKLDYVEKLITINREIHAKYDQLIQSVFLEKFGDPLVNPKKWDEAKIKKLGKVILGNTPPKKEPENYGDEIEWVKTSNIDESRIHATKAEESLSQKGKELGRVIPEGSLIVCCIAGSLSSIGKCAITDREIAINQQINAIVPDTEVVDVNYLYTFLLVGQELIQDASTKSMKGMVSKTRFKEIELMLPPLELQKEFSRIFKKIIDEKRKLIMESGKSQELYSSLLQQSFAYE